MIRSVVYKDDSFLVKYILKNELNEVIILDPYGAELNIPDQFELLHKSRPYLTRYCPVNAYAFVLAWLKKKPDTPSGYYRLNQPLFKYRLSSDPETAPYRGVYGEPPEVILTDLPLTAGKSKWFDETRPYAEDFLKNIAKVFRVIDISEYSYYYEALFTETIVFGTASFGSDPALRINLGGTNLHRFSKYIEETAESNEYAEIWHFNFNMPNQILIAKAGEELRYYDLKKVNNGNGDCTLFPLVRNGSKAYVLLQAIPYYCTPEMVIAENSCLTREEIYNLIANFFAIQHMNSATLTYYDLITGSQRTYTLPNNLILLNWRGTILGDKFQSDGSLKFSEQTINIDRCWIINLSNATKTVSLVKVFVGNVDASPEELTKIAEKEVNWTLGVLTYYNPSIDLNVDLTQVGSTVVNGEAVGTGDGATKEFYLVNKPIKEGSETIYVDGTALTRDQDYTIDYETGKITFTTAPANGAEITADYIYYKRFRISFLDPDGNELAFIDRWATFEF